jgi:hypothetical protein
MILAMKLLLVWYASAVGAGQTQALIISRAFLFSPAPPKGAWVFIFVCYGGVEFTNSHLKPVSPFARTGCCCTSK